MNLSNIIKMRPDAGDDGIDLPTNAIAEQNSDKFVSLQSLWQVKSGNVDMAGPDPLQVLREEQDRLRSETEKMVAEAEAGVAEIEEQAREKGFARGREEGLAAGKAEFAGRIGRVDDLLAAIHNKRQILHKQYERDLLPLVKAVSNRLLNQEILTNPQVVRAGLHEAMEYVVENSRVKVLLNPDDYATLNTEGLDASLAGHKQLTLVADEGIAAGGCFLETDFGEIDATLEVRLEKLYEVVDQAFIAALEEGADNEAAAEPQTNEPEKSEEELEPESR